MKGKTWTMKKEHREKIRQARLHYWTTRAGFAQKKRLAKQAQKASNVRWMRYRRGQHLVGHK